MRCDVAIAGAGPAGLTAAILLARAGARVVILAPRRRARPRPGETLPGAGLRLLRSLDLPAPVALETQRPLSGIASAWNTPRPVETDYFASPDGPAWLIDRSAFDAALAGAAARAGVHVLDRPAALPTRSGRGWVLDSAGRSVAADLLVDASGRAGRLAQQLGSKRVVQGSEMAWWAVAEGKAPARLRRPMIERQDEGWWFAVALDASRSYAAFHGASLLGAGPGREAEWHRRLRATRWIGAHLPGDGHFGRIRGCQASGSRLDRPVGPGWAGCGDAAIALDPLSSQGLLSAMAGGHMLATALTGTGASRDAALSGYAERLEVIWSVYTDRRARLMAA